MHRRPFSEAGYDSSEAVVPTKANLLIHRHSRPGWWRAHDSHQYHRSLFTHYWEVEAVSYETTGYRASREQGMIGGMFPPIIICLGCPRFLAYSHGSDPLLDRRCSADSFHLALHIRSMILQVGCERSKHEILRHLSERR